MNVTKSQKHSHEQNCGFVHKLCLWGQTERLRAAGRCYSLHPADPNTTSQTLLGDFLQIDPFTSPNTWSQPCAIIEITWRKKQGREEEEEIIYREARHSNTEGEIPKCLKTILLHLPLSAALWSSCSYRHTNKKYSIVGPTNANVRD